MKNSLVVKHLSPRVQLLRNSSASFTRENVDSFPSRSSFLSSTAVPSDDVRTITPTKYEGPNHCH